jgi:hypothetical protein
MIWGTILGAPVGKDGSQKEENEKGEAAGTR